MNKKIKVGSRQSPLALVQVKEIFSLFEKAGLPVDYELVTFATAGDKDKTTPLTVQGQDDFFTDTLDQALLDKKIDIAIHSAKDLPQNIREGLSIYALTEALDTTDAFVGRVKFAQLKVGARVGTSSLVRQQGLKDLNPNIQAVDIRGTIEERIKLVDEGKCDGVIVATCALKRLGLANRITDILPWEPMPLQGQLAVVGRRDNPIVREMFAAIDVRTNYGKVKLVGAGPGDPDLITVKAIKALQTADCIFYDFLAHKDLLDYAPYAEKVYVGKRKGEHSIPQAELSKLLKEKALSGKNVVRLKGGDPLIFGRGADEITYLRSYHISVEVIPGISSATGIPSGLAIPLTARGVSSSVAFVSGHGEDETHDQANELIEIPKTDTIVFFMGLTKIGLIVKSLIKAGWKTSVPMIVISKGTRVEERIVAGNLGNIEQLVAAAKLEPPVLMIAGPTVNFYKPQAQAKILFLGTNPEKYKALGKIIPHPMIEISSAKLDNALIEKTLRPLSKYQIILFTSRFAVKHFFELLEKENIPRDFIGIDVAVIGEDTAWALAQYGFKAKVMAEDETSEGMLMALEDAYDLKGKKILFPRSSLENPYLRENLRKLGAEVLELAVYENIKPAKRPLPSETIDKVFFTSPSTVRNFLEDYGTIPPEWKILSKGPHTKQALEKAGYKDQVSIVNL
jgi:uroporphyrinogen III methyltransferase/synthase